MNKFQKSLIDEANDAIREQELRIKVRRREDLFERWADRVFWAVVGAAVWSFFIAFKWNLFQYLISQLWQKIISWTLS